MLNSGVTLKFGSCGIRVMAILKKLLPRARYAPNALCDGRRYTELYIYRLNEHVLSILTSF